MTVVRVEGKGNTGVRAGARVLSLLAAPLNVHTLMVLEEEPKSLVDLRRAVGSPPQTTMRGHLRTLAELGIVERRRQGDFPGSVDYELGRPGRDLLPVVAVLRDWLADSPEGPVEIGSSGAKSAVKALVEGWSSAILRALAAKPLSLTELSRLITGLSYPSLERRLGAMRLAGQIERCSGGGRGTPYAVTDWLRRAVGPIAAAIRWERRNAPSTSAPPARIDIEAAFLLTVPILSPTSSVSGLCKLAVELRNGNGETHPAGVLVGVEEGQIASCVSRLEGPADAWASGSAAAWLRAVIDGEPGLLEVGGKCDLAYELLDGLHSVLFRARQRT